MAKCMQCGGMKKATKMKKGGVKKMKLGGTKKMDDGGNTYGAKVREASNKFFPMSGPTGPNYQGIDTMKKGGTTDSRYNRAVSPGCRGGYVKDANGNCVPERTAKIGGALKSVPADKLKSLGKLPEAVRNKMGFKKSGGMTKKANGGPIIDKIKEKLKERKVTKAIKKSVKSSGKIVK